MKMKPLVSIIIVNWNAKEYLEKCISSLLAQTYTNNEIIFIDNASTDNSIPFVKEKFPMVKILKNKKNLGFAEGNNIGIKNSKGDLIALFNPDAIADKDWLSNLVQKIQSSNKIGGVAGKIFYLNEKFGKNSVFCTWSKIDPYSAMPYNFHNDEPSSNVDYLSGAAMLVKKEVIDKVGFLDPEYFLYFEETDWCARMIRAGYDLTYVLNAIAWHEVSSTISDDEKKTYFMERSRIRFALKNFDLSYLLIFYFRFFIGETIFVFLRDLKNRNFSRSRTRIRAIVWNFINFKKIVSRRNKDMKKLKLNGKMRSYNRSLPLQSIKAN